MSPIYKTSSCNSGAAMKLMDQITRSGQSESATTARHCMTDHYSALDKVNKASNTLCKVVPATAEGASAVMWRSDGQPAVSYVEPLHTRQNQLQQNQTTQNVIVTSSISSSNEKSYCSYASTNQSYKRSDTTCFSLLDYILNDESSKPTSTPCPASSVQSPVEKPLQTYEPFTIINPSTFPSSSENDTSCPTSLNGVNALSTFSTSTFQSSTSNTSIQHDEQNLVAHQPTTVTWPPQSPTSTTKLNGPNEFNLTIALSPLDVSTKLVEWIYIDKTGQELVLKQNTSNMFEHLFNTYRALNATVKIRLPETGREYKICLKDMQMIDVHTGEKIALFRKTWMSGVFQPLETGLGGFPLLWSPQENDIELVVLDKKREEYRAIRNTFLRSMPESCVIGIERIQNKKLFVRYAFQKALLLDKNSGNEQSLNEKMLFHGTSQTPPSKIWQSEDGFDLRYSRRGMWGIGSYFAEKASYSDKYAYTYSTNLIQCSEMLVASVLTGNSKEMLSNYKSRSLTRPPVYIDATTSNPEVLYDTVTGYTKGSRIYVLYKLDMAYPSYLVRYFKLDI